MPRLHLRINNRQLAYVLVLFGLITVTLAISSLCNPSTTTAARPKLRWTALVTQPDPSLAPLVTPQHCILGRNDSLRWMNATDSTLHIYFKGPGVDAPSRFDIYAAPGKLSSGVEWNLGTVSKLPYFIVPDDVNPAGYVSTTDGQRSCSNGLTVQAYLPSISTDKEPVRGPVVR